MAATLAKLISLINEHHVLLVYPIQNSFEPFSLWGLLHPRKKMRWEWDSDGDNNVADLWHLRERLSRSGKVVYSKWYQGRATFFSKEAFTLLLAAQQSPHNENQFHKSTEARKIYESLDEHSPQSTKTLKKNVELQGRLFEAAYQRALKELFLRGLVVGWGEKDEGAFPSLNLAATKHVFEAEWAAARARIAGGSRESQALEARNEFLQLIGKQKKVALFFSKHQSSSQA